jgi:hypothetical protein
MLFSYSDDGNFHVTTMAGMFEYMPWSYFGAQCRACILDHVRLCPLPGLLYDFTNDLLATL